ncbi:MAG: transglycosylase SLT domain-containing protein [Pseudomonadota bacterium]
MRHLCVVLAACLLSACQSIPLDPPAPIVRADSAQGPTPAPEVHAPGQALRDPSVPVANAIGSGAPPPPATDSNTIAPDLLAANDLWGHMRRGFAVPPLTHELVATHARRFAAKDFLAARAERIGLYLPLIIEELEQRQMPLELALLPLVESALNPHARSAVGAVGFWQFMTPTAHDFELRTSHLVDDRKNLRQATRAALDYLQRLYQQFGDWHLAMAAYNWGEGNIAKAAARQRQLGLPVNFNTLAPHMPAETRNYVPQILALAQLVAAPDKYSTRLPALPDHNPLVEVKLRHDIDLSLVLQMSGISQREFSALNPAVKPPLVLAAATPRLLLPADAALRFESKLSEHTGSTASWSVQKLGRTQALEQLVARHGASLELVRQINAIPHGMKPAAGSTLLLPGAAPAGSRVNAELVASASLSVVPDIVKVTTRARPKESLADVARRCGVRMQDLGKWNQVPPKRQQKALTKGRVLTVWVAREHAAAYLAVAMQTPVPSGAGPAARPPGHGRLALGRGAAAAKAKSGRV